MAYAILAVVAVLAVGLVVGAVFAAGVGGLLVALALLTLLVGAVLSPPRRTSRSGRGAPSTWYGFGLPSRRDNDPIE